MNSMPAAKMAATTSSKKATGAKPIGKIKADY
jgi:hypothetical protein